ILNRLGVWMFTGRKVTSITVNANGKFVLKTTGNTDDELFDAVVIATGGWRKDSLYDSLAALGVEMVAPVPSLFSLKVKSNILTNLMGASVENAIVQIPGQKFRAEGGLIVTHFGFSGPAVLKMSSYAARYLADNNYKCDILINWLGKTDDDVRKECTDIAVVNPRKTITSAHPRGLTQRLWEYLLSRAEIDPATKYSELGKKNLNKLISTLTADLHHVSGRGQFKDEFVTCGGVSLGCVNAKTLESKNVPRLYFAGEALDVDAVTGGYNLQNCWTTGYVVAEAIKAIDE
nr:aminoacetone oxidase family FAD-binding enzyme [Bacteroidales bacterium]